MELAAEAASKALKAEKDETQKQREHASKARQHANGQTDKIAKLQVRPRLPRGNPRGSSGLLFG